MFEVINHLWRYFNINIISQWYAYFHTYIFSQDVKFTSSHTYISILPHIYIFSQDIDLKILVE